MRLKTKQNWTKTFTDIAVTKELAGDLEELVSAEFSRLRDFLLEEEQRVKGKLQKQKEEKLQQLEEALTQTTEQISRLESTADQLRLKLREEENPEQLKVREPTALGRNYDADGAIVNCTYESEPSDIPLNRRVSKTSSEGESYLQVKHFPCDCWPTSLCNTTAGMTVFRQVVMPTSVCRLNYQR